MSGWWLISYGVLWVLVVVLCAVVVALARQIGTLHLRLGPRGALEIDDEGPPLGEQVDPVPVTGLDGEELVLGGGGSPQLLLFVSPGCDVCRQVLPSVDAVARGGSLAPVVVTDTGETETRAAYRHKHGAAPLVASLEACETYGVPGTPYVLVLDAQGIVQAKGTANNLEQMEGLVDTARRRLDGHPAAHRIREEVAS
jgi:methylamine dehydrogenase accessory protein MauD